jgi:transcriptional regulator with XRE-family HTH domain
MMALDPHNLGRRLRTLRLRRGLSLAEVGNLANLDISYLSRLERDALRNATPKPETINRVLDALHATIQERDAVYHLERPTLKASEIVPQIHAVAESVEADEEPVALIDELWFVWYYNQGARAALGFTAEEYRRAIGSHILHSMIDPANPHYSRLADEEREATFARHARLFKVNFAGQEFDRWYEEVVARLYDVGWAARVWEDPPAQPDPLLVERQPRTIENPFVGALHFTMQMNHLTTNPRFLLGTWSAADEQTAARVRELRDRPEFDYSYVVALPETEVYDSPVAGENLPAGFD